MTHFVSKAVEIGTLTMGMQTDTRLQSTIWQCLTKLHIPLSFAPAIPLLRIYSEYTPPTIQKYLCTRLLIAVLSVIEKY